MYVGNAQSKPSLVSNDAKMAIVAKVKDLGVIVDSRLNFDTHIRQAVARAFVRSNVIHKCFVSHDVFNLVHAFKVYVLSIIEYASCVWSPYHVNLVKLIESVQRKFTKRLPGYASLSYKDRLSHLALHSLELRCLRYDLLLTYKIVFRLTDIVASDMFTLTNFCTILTLEVMPKNFIRIIAVLMYVSSFFLNGLKVKVKKKKSIYNAPFILQKYFQGARANR